MYALIIARHKMFPGHKEGGMRTLDRQPVCYTSKHVSSVLEEGFGGIILVVWGDILNFLGWFS